MGGCYACHLVLMTKVAGMDKWYNDAAVPVSAAAAVADLMHCIVHCFCRAVSRCAGGRLRWW